MIGSSWLDTALDDHSRLAYTELLPDERQETAAACWRRAQAWFEGCGVWRVVAADAEMQVDPVAMPSTSSTSRSQ